MQLGSHVEEALEVVAQAHQLPFQVHFPQSSGHAISRQPDFEHGEDRFWTHCATNMPLETAAASFSYEFVDGDNPCNRLIHDPLREFFKKEAADGTQEKLLMPQDDQRLRTALLMLASWKLEER